MNEPTAYEIINYINDVSLNNAEVLMTSDREGKYNTAYTYGLERISVDNLNVEDSFKEEPLFYLYDGRGNTTELTDNRGVARDRYRYDPYGMPIPKATIGPNPWYTDNPYRYNGEDYDINSGLQYLRARYYEPSTGRFLSRDSYLGDMTDPLTQNRYIYTLNNPIKYSDPSGHRVIMDDGEYYYPEKTSVSGSSELLKFGARGESVKELQQLLISSGFGVGSSGADGIFGNGTLSAVTAYQESKGLTRDGIVGAQTWGSLRGSASTGASSPNISASNQTVRKGSSGEAVKKLQQTLMGLGYDLGSYGADGKFGSKTEQAVINFQRNNGLTIDGIVGNQTWAALAAKNTVSNNKNSCDDLLGSNSGGKVQSEAFRNFAIGVVASLIADGLGSAQVISTVMLSIFGNDVMTRNYRQVAGLKNDAIRYLEGNVTDNVSYYAGRTVTDAILTLIGVGQTVVGIKAAIAGGAGLIGSALGEGITLGAGTPAFALTAGASLAITAAGAANASAGFTLATTSLKNGLKNSNKLKDAIKGVSKASSKVLRQNLIDAGMKVPDYANAAHHIVAGTSKKASESQAILKNFGIDINDAANGVFLPTAKEVSNSAYHPSLHTNAYYNKVNDMLRGATSKDDVLDILSDISEQLSKGTFMK